MTIAYQILCKNEDTSLDKLLSLLTSNIREEDEINVCRDKLGTNSKTKKVISKYDVRYFEREITHTIHNQKNWLAEQTSADYLFYLDADELLPERLLKSIPAIIDLNDSVDVFFFPRRNIVEGLTEDYRASRGWKVDPQGRINWPDVQDRLFKHGKGIRYNEIPHGRLIGQTNYVVMPIEEIYAIDHVKTMEKQVSDNAWHDNKEVELGLRAPQFDQTNFTGWAIGSKLAAWIASNIPQGSTVLEFGSGTGSHELGKFYKMHCVEHDEQWLNKFDNLQYYHAPIVDGWYDTSVLEKLPTDYDLLIIDGPPGGIGRGGIVNHLDRLNLNVPIVIDDVERKAEYDVYLKVKEFVGDCEEVVLTENNKQTIVLLPNGKDQL